MLEAAAETDRAEVIAVASRDAGGPRAYAREHGLERAYGSYEALLEDADVEAVYIPLPNSMHVEWTLRALEAGKHVLCEKPFSRRRKESSGRSISPTERGLVLSEAFMWRHHPQTRSSPRSPAGARRAPAAGARGLQLPARGRPRRPTTPASTPSSTAAR